MQIIDPIAWKAGECWMF